MAAVASASGLEGLLTALTPGATQVRADLGAVSASTAVGVSAATLVSLEIAPLAPTLAAGLTQQLGAIGTFTDSTTQDLTASVTWASDDALVAAVSNAGGSEGLLTAIGVGSAQISVTLGTVSASTTAGITAATLVSLAITPSVPRVPAGLTQQLAALGTFSDSTTQDLTTTVTWSSDDALVAAVSNAGGFEGLLTAVAVGSAQISATLGAVNTATITDVTAATLVSLAITPASPSQGLGLPLQLTATGTYTDSSTQDLTDTVTWSSANTVIVVVSNAAGLEGLATTLVIGVAQVTATLGAVSDTVTFDVHL